MQMPAFMHHCPGKAMTDLAHSLHRVLETCNQICLRSGPMVVPGNIYSLPRWRRSRKHHCCNYCSLTYFNTFSFALLQFQLPACNTKIKTSNRQAGTTHATTMKRQLSQEPSCTAVLPSSLSNKHTYAHVCVHARIHEKRFAYLSGAHSCTAYFFCQNTYWHSTAPSTFLMTAFYIFNLLFGTVEWVLRSDSYSVHKTMFSPFLTQTKGDQKFATFLFLFICTSLFYHNFSLHLNLKENSKTVAISYRKT